MASIAAEAFIIIAVYAIVWQGYKLRRRLNGFAHVALLVFVVGTLLPQIGSTIIYQDGLSEEVGSIVTSVSVNVPIVGLFCFRLGLEGHTLRDRRVLLTIASGVVVSLITIVLGILSIRAGVPLVHGGSGELYLHPTSAASSLLNSVYRVVMIFWFGLWVFPFTARVGTPRPLKLGMRVAAVGILLFGLVPATGLVTGVATIIAGEPVRGSLLPLMILGQIVAGACWAIGLSYPLIASRLAAHRAGRDQRRDLGRIAALWEVGLDAFPEVGRPEGASREPVAFQLQRRKGECYDCLHHLRLYEDSVAAAASPEAVRLLETALQSYEDRHDESVWAAIDRNRDADPAERDMQLLIELSDHVDELRATRTVV